MKSAFFVLVLSSFFTFASAQGISNAQKTKSEFDGYIVKLKKHANIKKNGLLLKSFGPNPEIIKTSFGNFAKIDKMPSKNAKDKSFIPTGEIDYIEPNWIRYRAEFTDPVFPMYDEFFREQWGLESIGYTKLMSKNNTSEIKIAVLDSGVDYSHEDLKGQILINDEELNGDPGVDDDFNGVVDDIVGYNFIDNSPDPMDIDKHGTHCAGVIAAKHNKIGIAGLVPNGKILPVKIFNSKGETTSLAIIQAIEYGIVRGVHIMSNSYTGYQFSQSEKDAIEEANEHGIVFVAAAGNDNKDIDEVPAYPASYDVPNVISVGAVDDIGKITEFSNYGKASVDILAPGYEILSTVPNDRYLKLDGTSMATPLVAGMVGLLLDKDMSLTPADLRKLIIDGGVTWGRFSRKNTEYSIGGNAHIGYSLNITKSASFSLTGSISHHETEPVVFIDYKVNVSGTSLENKPLELLVSYFKDGEKVREYFDVDPKALTSSVRIILEGFTKSEVYKPDFDQKVKVELMYKTRKLTESDFPIRSKKSSLEMLLLESSLDTLSAKVLIRFDKTADVKILPSQSYGGYEVLRDDSGEQKREMVILFKELRKEMYLKNQIFFEAILLKGNETVGAKKIQLVSNPILDVSFDFQRVNYPLGTVGFRYDVYTAESLEGAVVEVQIFNEKTSKMIYNYKGWTNKSGVTFIADTQEFGIDGWHFVGKKWFNTNDPINLVVKTFVGGEPAKVEKYQFPEIKLDNLTIDHTISYFNHVINGKFDLDKNQRENRIINLRSLFDVLNEEEVKAFAAQKMNPYEDDPDSTILGKLVVGKKNSSRPEVYRSIGEALSDASSHLSLFKRSAYKKLIKELIQ